MGFEEAKVFWFAAKALLLASPCTGLTNCLGIYLFS